MLLDGTRDWLFGATLLDSPVRDANLALPIFGVLTLVLAVVGTAFVVWRYRRIAA